MKGLPICFSEVQVQNDVTDNNNKHFATAFEGECRNIIELREHLKLCFLIILVVVVVVVVAYPSSLLFLTGVFCFLNFILPASCFSPVFFLSPVFLLFF